MGASKKWIKTVFGLQNANNNSSGSTNNISHQRRHSEEYASPRIEKGSNSNVITESEGAKDASFHSAYQWDEFYSGVHDNESEAEPIVATDAEDAQDDSFLSTKQSCEIDSGMSETESDYNVFEDAKGSQSVSNLFSSRLFDINNQNAEDSSLLSVLDLGGLPSSSLEDKKDAQPQQQTRQEWAATRIQAAFKRYLARRNLRATRGLVRLQALITGRAVKKQAAITLHSMQDLVKVQARVRAKRVRMGLENHIAEQKLQPEFEKEAPIKETHIKEIPIKEIPFKEIEGGWCSGIGSAEEMKAKTLRRKEAAVKRQKAMQYALARQWQASSRRKVKPASPGQDKTYWCWNWLDSWLSSSQWENRAVDISLEDGAPKNRGNEAATSRSSSAVRRSASDVGNRRMVRCPSTRSEEKGVSSPMKAGTLKETLSPRTPTKSPRCSLKDSREELSVSRLGPRSHSSLKERSPVGDNPERKRLSFLREESSLSRLGSRSHSTPKERSPLGDNLKSKRLSLPGTGPVAKQQVSQVGAKKITRTKSWTSNGKDLSLSPRRM